MTGILTDEEVMEFEAISSRTFFRRLESGELRRLPEEAPGAGSIDPASLSLRARQRRLQRGLASIPSPSASEPRPSEPRPSEPRPQGSGPCQSEGPSQKDLFLPDCIAALSIPMEQKEVVSRRMALCQETLNGNWRAQGFARKRDFVYELAARYQVSGRSVERWLAKYRASVSPANPLGDPRTLLDRKPGPAPGDLTAIEDWAALDLAHAYVDLKLTVRQCYERLLAELRRRQGAWGIRDIYPVPAYATVARFLARLDPLAHARRGGPAALKAAAGHIERSYSDLHSLGRVETDEWITDVLGYDPKHAARAGRYYLLTLFDARALYPLLWALVEKSRQPEADKKRLENVELNLLVELIRQYGVPGILSSDRGRFRSSIFGGQPARYVPGERSANNTVGILDRLGIRRNMPREHNPRGSRLERFHKELATWARTLPGWLGANTTERQMAPGDAQTAEHHLYIRGKRPSTPLLSRDQLLARIDEFMAAWRERPSEGRDMNGLSPATVFQNSRPLGGFRRVSEGELAWVTAEHFQDELVQTGGIIQLPDKRRYHHKLLLLLQGQRRQVVRLRQARSFISVLPAKKYEEVIFADGVYLVGCNDSKALAAACEYQARIRKVLASQHASRGDGEVAAQYRPEAPAVIPSAADAIPARDFFADEPAAASEPATVPAAAAGAGSAIPDEVPGEKPVPSLYDYDEPTVETL